MSQEPSDTNPFYVNPIHASVDGSCNLSLWMFYMGYLALLGILTLAFVSRLVVQFALLKKQMLYFQF